MSEPQIDNSDLGGNQGTDWENNQPWEELIKIQAQLSASSSESKLLNEVTKVLVSNDFEYFEELLSKDSRMAEKVIDKIAKQKWISPDDVRSQLTWNIQPKAMTSYDIEQEVKRTIAKQDWEKALEEFIKEVWLTKEENDDFMDTFNEYMEGKDFTLANVKRFSKSAYRDLKEDKVKSFEKKKWDIESQINAWWSTKEQAKKTPELLWSNNTANDW